MNHQKLLLPIALLASMLFFGITSCRNLADIHLDQTDLSNLIAPSGFKFSTHKELNVRIKTLDNENNPVANIRVGLYTDYPDSIGRQIYSGVTDVNGVLEFNYQMPAETDSLVISTNAIGFINQQKVNVSDGSLDCTLGGGSAVTLRSGKAEEPLFSPTMVTASTVYKALSTYSSLGVPQLASPNDLVDATMLADINSTLPESVSLITTHPQYLSTTTNSILKITEASNVWLTFIHEGTTAKNVIGYYKYKSSNPPTSASAIDSVFLVFPNMSYAGSGGGLYSGNRMNLGQFPAGTEIGWLMIVDGWYNSAIKTSGKTIYYSHQAFNPETTAAQKQHAVLLNDFGRGKFLLGFEGTRRNFSSCDHDFNDGVFYVTVNPARAVETANMQRITPEKIDADFDGIADHEDAYPNDASKAFNNFFPSQNANGTLSFEDLWPSQGDYDFNDMVLDYNFNQVTNAQNKVVQIVATIKLKAMGASFHSGFGIQLPLTPNQISSVTGCNLQEDIIALNQNGTEAGQSKATIIAFDDGYNVLPWASGSANGGVNTFTEDPYVTPQLLTLTISLTNPITISDLGTPPYNPFIIINGERSKEVHLIDQPPTDLADKSLLGTFMDDSRPSSGRYYVTPNNLPFAINISEEFEYPKEKEGIAEAYLKFFPWGEAGGSTFKDWHKNLEGYRNSSSIYKH